MINLSQILKKNDNKISGMTHNLFSIEYKMTSVDIQIDNLFEQINKLEHEMKSIHNIGRSRNPFTRASQLNASYHCHPPIYTDVERKRLSEIEESKNILSKTIKDTQEKHAKNIKMTSIDNHSTHGKIELAIINSNGASFNPKTTKKLHIYPFTSEQVDFNQMSTSFGITKNIYIIHQIVVKITTTYCGSPNPLNNRTICINDIYLVDNYGNIYKTGCETYSSYPSAFPVRIQIDNNSTCGFSFTERKTYHNMFDNVLTNYQINIIKKQDTLFTFEKYVNVNGGTMVQSGAEDGTINQIVNKIFLNIINIRQTPVLVQETIQSDIVESLSAKIKELEQKLSERESQKFAIEHEKKIMECEHAANILECINYVNKIKEHHSLQIKTITNERPVQKLLKKPQIDVFKQNKTLECQQPKYIFSFD